MPGYWTTSPTTDEDVPRFFWTLTGSTDEEIDDLYWTLTGTTDELAFVRPNRPNITRWSVSPASLTSAQPSQNLTLAWTVDSATSITITEHLADGRVFDLSGTIPQTQSGPSLNDQILRQRPTQDAEYRITCTNVEGPSTTTARFDYRTPLSGLAITVTGYVPQNIHAGTREQPRLQFSWTGDRTSADVHIHDPGNGTTPTGYSNVVNGGIHTPLIIFGHGGPRDVIVTLQVGGWSAANQGVGLTTQRTLHIPGRAGG